MDPTRERTRPLRLDPVGAARFRRRVIEKSAERTNKKTVSEKPSIVQCRGANRIGANMKPTIIDKPKPRKLLVSLLVGVAALAAASSQAAAQQQQKRPNIVMLMSDDAGWADFGPYLGGAALGHPTPNIDRLAKEGVTFTNWYGQASCTAGRASFMTGRIPIRSALSVVVVPGDPNGLKKETPTIAEFYQKNGYSTYFSGKWHLGDRPEFYPIEHGFDEMKQFAAYYPGVYAYSDTSPYAHPWFPKGNAEFWKMYTSVVNLYEWEGTAGSPAVKGDNGAVITLENLAEFDMRQTDSAIEYIKKHAKDSKPFFMDVNFMKLHQPTSPNKMFAGKSHLGNYSDSVLELDYNVGRIMDVIRAEAPDTIVIFTADNGAWQDAWPDAGAHPYRGEKGSAFEAGWRVPGIMWAPGKIPAGVVLHEMMSHMDVWPTTATMVGLQAPTKGEMMDNNGKPIYFDGIDNSAYVTGKAKHSARDSWIYIDGESFQGMRADIDNEPDIRIAWKYLWTSKDTWLGPDQSLGAIGSTDNLTMDPYEKYDMTFNGAVSTRSPTTSPGRYAGMDNGWVFSLVDIPLTEFNKSIVKYPNIERFPGGASNDLKPNLQNPKNPLPYDPTKLPKTVGSGGG
jgi:arylsulfatase A-like enzyme